MRYTITEGPNAGKRINVPDEFIERTMRSLDVDRKQAVAIYISDEGWDIDPIVEELTAKAHEAGTTAKNVSDKPKRKAPERKPDEVKRAVIAALAEFIEGTEHVANVEVMNVERMIGFTLGGERFEVTLTKKRKPKE